MKRLEYHMIEPTRLLMTGAMNLDIVIQEFSAGYGIADLVGASISSVNCKNRSELGLTAPLDHQQYSELLLLLKPGVRRSMKYILDRISFSESTLRKKILPKLLKYGMIRRDNDGYLQLVNKIPVPTKSIVAVEMKQTKWRDAILQARRYTNFANKTYIAVWNGTAEKVDRAFLYKHRIGLIGVEPDYAMVLIEAPDIKPRKPKMNLYCAEFMYRQALVN